MRIFIILLSFFLANCKNDSANPNSTGKDSNTPIKDPDTPSSSGTILYVWEIDYDNKIKSKNPGFKQEYLNVDTLIKGLNELYPNIKLEKIKISGDTLFAQIKDSEYLGERMGSYGAGFYIDNAVINLTSVGNINYVKIDFEEHSHISPGVWSKKDYEEYKEIR